MTQNEIEELEQIVRFEADGSLRADETYISWNTGNTRIKLDGDFTTRQLELIILWIKETTHENSNN